MDDDSVRILSDMLNRIEWIQSDCWDNWTHQDILNFYLAGHERDQDNNNINININNSNNNINNNNNNNNKDDVKFISIFGIFKETEMP